MTNQTNKPTGEFRQKVEEIVDTSVYLDKNDRYSSKKCVDAILSLVKKEVKALRKKEHCIHTGKDDDMCYACDYDEALDDVLEHLK